MGEAVKMIGRENLADHIDMNFGCPVPKVTRKGGGAALPFKRNLFREIVKALWKTLNHLESLSQSRCVLESILITILI
jgi:tRNA-dihydrouridine synthase